jgi:hypothetical protein
MAMLHYLVEEPAVRNYFIAALAALVLICLILFEELNSSLGALAIFIAGFCGVVLRWKAAPGLILLLLTYFLYTPYGIPGEGYSYIFLIEERRFNVTDLLLVLATLVYVACQFRLYGLVHQAIAFDGVMPRKGETPTRRPAHVVAPTELVALLALAVGLVLVGESIWYLATSVDVAPGEWFPLQWAERETLLSRLQSSLSERTNILSPGMSRFFVLLGLVFLGTVAARVVFGYWRLRTLSALEGAMIVLDTGWRETNRERVRLEKWRVWGRQRHEMRDHKIKPKQPGSKP